MERWIALDLETTGLSPTRHDIRELAAVPFGIDCDRTEQLLRFTQTDFRHSARTQLAELLEHIGDHTVLVAHNAAFDLAFLAETLRKARLSPFTLRAYCTLRLARRLLPDLARYDLASLRKTLYVDTGKPHTALADARAVAALFTALVRQADCGDEQALRGLHGPMVEVRTLSALGNHDAGARG